MFRKVLSSALDTFLRETPATTRSGPHIRDSIDVKRWMMLVVLALSPCIAVAIWNSGVQSLVYSSKELLPPYLIASQSWGGYWAFVLENGRWLSILGEGCLIFLPIVAISYTVGGLWEALFAWIRKEEIAEGFLVTGILYPLTLPSTIPYWMVALGISFGVVLAKELFGGTGMNILNPALASRCFLYFAFPAAMTGSVWAGSSAIDGYSQPSALAVYNAPNEVKRIHVDAIIANESKREVVSSGAIQNKLKQWSPESPPLGQLSKENLRAFETAPIADGGLGLSSDNFDSAVQFAGLKEGVGRFTNGNLFFGNKLGSMGEVSILACLLGAFVLVFTGIGSWRTMAAVALGALLTGLLFEYGSRGGLWHPAPFDFPVYKHFLMGGLAFGLVFMATDPVSGPAMNSAKWAYGILIGSLTIVIRAVNPAYPEGVMLAILFGNVFAPLFDSWAVKFYRRTRHVC